MFIGDVFSQTHPSIQALPAFSLKRNVEFYLILPSRKLTLMEYFSLTGRTGCNIQREDHKSSAPAFLIKLSNLPSFLEESHYLMWPCKVPYSYYIHFIHIPYSVFDLSYQSLYYL